LLWSSYQRRISDKIPDEIAKIARIISKPGYFTSTKDKMLDKTSQIERIHNPIRLLIFPAWWSTNNKFPTAMASKDKKNQFLY
jgi:hypothetical protein